MNDPESTYYQVQLCDEIIPPSSGKQSTILVDDEQSKVIAFGFAAGAGLAEHVAPLPATIQIISGEAILTAGNEAVEGKPGTYIRMPPKTPHSISATTPLVMLLTLQK
ncbi:MAG: cupin domain-containing protein [Rubripirellula sp.]